MKKWFAVLRISIIQAVSFRTEMMLWVILDIFPTLILVATWYAIAAGKNMIGSQTLSQLITYYLSVLIIINIAEVHFEERWIENVRYGKIDQYFIKPIPFPLFIFLETLGRKIIAFATFIVPFSLFAIALVTAKVITLPQLHLAQLSVFFLFLIAAFAFNSLMSFFAVLCAFWMDEASSIGHFKWMISGVFGGTLAPLTMYPMWIQRISEFLPFQRTIFTPATLLSKQISTAYALKELSILVAYIIIIAYIENIIWRKAMAKYTSAGG